MATLPFDMEIEDIAALAAIIKKNDLEELRLTDEELRMKLVIKGRSGKNDHNPPPPPPPVPNPLPPAAPPAPQIIVVPAGGNAVPAGAQAEVPAPSAAQPSAPAPVKEAAPAGGSGTTVKAPIVGTYYAASAPGKPPFVTVGRRIKKGDVIMIIETMKLMNEIQSDIDGVVTKIFVKDGQAVEFDQPIMVIE